MVDDADDVTDVVRRTRERGRSGDEECTSFLPELSRPLPAASACALGSWGMSPASERRFTGARTCSRVRVPSKECLAPASCRAEAFADSGRFDCRNRRLSSVNVHSREGLLARQSSRHMRGQRAVLRQSNSSEVACPSSSRLTRSCRSRDGLHPRLQPPALESAEAANELYERYHDRIYAFCMSRTRNPTDAEDATQTAFMHALNGLRRGVVPQFELTWLLKIAENVCHSMHRRAYRRYERDELPVDLASRQDDLGPSPNASTHSASRSSLSRTTSAGRCSCASGVGSRTTKSPTSSSSHAAVETMLFRARRRSSSSSGRSQRSRSPRSGGSRNGCRACGREGRGGRGCHDRHRHSRRVERACGGSACSLGARASHDARRDPRGASRDHSGRPGSWGSDLYSGRARPRRRREPTVSSPPSGPHVEPSASEPTLAV